MRILLTSAGECHENCRCCSANLGALCPLRTWADRVLVYPLIWADTHKAEATDIHLLGVRLFCQFKISFPSTVSNSASSNPWISSGRGWRIFTSERKIYFAYFLEIFTFNIEIDNKKNYKRENLKGVEFRDLNKTYVLRFWWKLHFPILCGDLTL